MRPILLVGNRTVISKSFIEAVVQLAHDVHPGKTVMKKRLRAKLRSPRIDREVEVIVKHCRGSMLVSQPKRPPPMSRHSFPNGSWKCISIDLMVHYPTKI